MNTRAQYEIPTGFDLLYQPQLASAKKDEAEDNLLALRETLFIYFRESVEGGAGTHEMNDT